MSNFEGIQKNGRSFKPQTSGGGDDAGSGRVVACVYAGQTAPVVFEKGNEPVPPTDEPRPTDGKGEKELGLSGQVDHPDNSGSAKYLVQTVSRIYRQTLAGRNADTLSPAERPALRDRIIDGVGALMCL